MILWSQIKNNYEFAKFFFQEVTDKLKNDGDVPPHHAILPHSDNPGVCG